MTEQLRQDELESQARSSTEMILIQTQAGLWLRTLQPADAQLVRELMTASYLKGHTSGMAWVEAKLRSMIELVERKLNGKS